MPGPRRYIKSQAMINTANLSPEQRMVLDKYKAGEPLTEDERKVRFPGMITQRAKSGRGG